MTSNSKKPLRANLIGVLANERGLSLLEVLIAGVMFAFVLLSFGYVFAIGQGLLSGETERRMAVTLAQEAIEVRAASASTTAGFTSLEGEVAGGMDAENGITANIAPYFTANAYPNHRRETTIIYVQDDDYDQPDAGTNSLRITVEVKPITGGTSRPVEFSTVTLVTVVTRP